MEPQINQYMVAKIAAASNEMLYNRLVREMKRFDGQYLSLENLYIKEDISKKSFNIEVKELNLKRKTVFMKFPRIP
ncbi:hypothetical protein [Erysipelothrix aquatica]|uniref:hypothetical protein n=1 Tax=Erysipelothrix aquatica TaxID=2683714 RepID=UPI001359E234|nr:hypothetical protein [Erysipelothrix aquatica]